MKPYQETIRALLLLKQYTLTNHFSDASRKENDFCSLIPKGKRSTL